MKVGKNADINENMNSKFNVSTLKYTLMQSDLAVTVKLTCAHSATPLRVPVMSHSQSA